MLDTLMGKNAPTYLIVVLVLLIPIAWMVALIKNKDEKAEEKAG